VTGALHGIRVLDLADEKGALAGKLLAGHGADVVLVEPPGGSGLRSIPPFWQGTPAAERSIFFWLYAAGKRSVTLDVATPAGAARLRRLVADADVLIETGPPGRLDVLGVGADALREVNPRLVVASITPFGQRGPYRSWRASDTVAQAMGGMLYVNGHAEGPPLRALGLQAYHQAGIFAAIGIVSALLARDETAEPRGAGRRRDIERDAPFPRRVEPEEDAPITVRRPLPEGRDRAQAAPARRLDEDDVGAEAGEELAGERALLVGEVEDADPVHLARRGHRRRNRSRTP